LKTAIAALFFKNSMIAIWDWSSNTIYYSYSGYSPMTPSQQIKFLSNGLLVGSASASSMNIWYSNVSNVSSILNSGSYCRALEELSNGNLASAGDDKYINYWNLKTGALINRTNVGSVQNFLKQVGNYLVSASSNSFIFLWNITTLSMVGNLSGHTGAVRLLDATPNGLLLSVGFDFSMRLWNLTSRTCLSILSNPLGNNTSIKTLRVVSSNLTAVAGLYSQIALVQITNTNVLNISAWISLPGGTNVYDLRVSSNNVLVVAFSNGTMAFFNLTTNLLIQTLNPLGLTSPVYQFDIFSE
jgi:WD40 repeat protein